MNIENFICLLAIFATVTSLITEGVKKTLTALNVKYAANIVVLLVSLIVGGIGTFLFYIWKGYDMNVNSAIWIFLMTVANWLGSMVGYDKVIQTITQIKSSDKNVKTDE